MNEINTLKIRINELDNIIKDTEEKKNKLHEKAERSRLFALRCTIISAVMNFGGYFIHPVVPMAAIMLLGITVPIGGISMMVYEDKEEKCQKELDGYIKELEESKQRLEELTIPKQTPTITTPTIITKKENTIQKDNNIKKSR